MTRPRQQELPFRIHGGKRRGAGRKRLHELGRVAHHIRPEHKKAHPVHVTLRARSKLPSLRTQVVFQTIRRALGRTARSWFRVVHFSVQTNHIHLLIEANDKLSLARGLGGAAIRLARAINRAAKRKGGVWEDRYHSRPLRTPREVRNGLVYVLMNWKKHTPGAKGFDPCSSASSFEGWIVPPAAGPPSDDSIATPVTWLLRIGWKRHGLVALSERPRLVDRSPLPLLVE